MCSSKLFVESLFVCVRIPRETPLVIDSEGCLDVEDDRVMTLFSFNFFVNDSLKKYSLPWIKLCTR